MTDAFLDRLAWLEGKVDAWRRKLDALAAPGDPGRGAGPVWHVKANGVLVDVLMGLAFYPAAFNAALQTAGVSTPEREAAAARLRGKLSLDAGPLMARLGELRTAIDAGLMASAEAAEAAAPTTPSPPGT
jgi:hypothetical protein